MARRDGHGEERSRWRGDGKTGDQKSGDKKTNDKQEPGNRQKKARKRGHGDNKVRRVARVLSRRGEKMNGKQKKGKSEETTKRR